MVRCVVVKEQGVSETVMAVIGTLIAAGLVGVVAQLWRISVQLAEFGVWMKHNVSRLDNHEDRIEALENRP